MIDARSLALLTVWFAGCAPAATVVTDDTDNSDETDDTEPVKVPRDFELDPEAQNVFWGTYVAGQSELDLVFTDSLLYAVDNVDGFRFRSYAGTRDRDTADFYPNGAPPSAPDTISLEARVTLPVTRVEPGTYDCKGDAGAFSVSIRLFSKELESFVGFIASSILANESDGPCTIEVSVADVDRFQATIPSATMRTVEVPVGNEGETQSLSAKLEDVTIDFFLMEGEAPTSDGEFISPADTDDE